MSTRRDKTTALILALVAAPAFAHAPEPSPAPAAPSVRSSEPAPAPDSLGWIGASLGFSLAVPVLLGAARLYGALGSAVLFLIWAYLIAWILLLGRLLLARPLRGTCFS